MFKNSYFPYLCVEFLQKIGHFLGSLRMISMNFGVFFLSVTLQSCAIIFLILFLKITINTHHLISKCNQMVTSEIRE